MKHPSELEFSMYSDGEIDPTRRQYFEAHVRACASCRRYVASLDAESALLRQSIASREPVPVPAFARPVELGSLTLLALGLAFAAWLAARLWRVMLTPLEPAAQGLFLPIHPADSIAPAIETILFFSKGGSAMLTTLLIYIVVGVCLTSLAVLLIILKPPRAAFKMLALAFIGSGLFADPAQALEIRRGVQSVIVSDTEVIDDTVLVMSETSIINGTVNGDLIAMGRRVIVNGTVTGNVIALGRGVTITGQVGGSVLSAARNLTLENLDVEDNLWSFAANVRVDGGSRIQGNTTLFSNSGSVAGDVGRDLTGFAQYLEVDGTVGNDIEAWGEQLTLLGNAQVNGNLRLRTHNEDSLRQSPGAVVSGDIEVMLDEHKPRAGSKFANPEFYFRLLLRLVSAFVFGLLLFHLLPGLRNLNLSRGTAGLKTAGIGLLALVSTPIILILASLTIVAIPLALLGLFSWIVMIYLAKILIALLIGNLLLGGRDLRWPLVMPLLAGLIVVFIIISLPVIGVVLNFLLTIAGMGLITQFILASTRRSRATY